MTLFTTNMVTMIVAVKSVVNIIKIILHMVIKNTEGLLDKESTATKSNLDHLVEPDYM